MSEATVERWTSERLFKALRERYDAQAYALFAEVANATGGSKTRSADAVAMSLWPSRGLEIHGFELKISRSDWVRELENPAKAEAVARYCDRWWLVVSDLAIVKPGELPPTWGLLAPGKDERLKIKTEATKLEPVALNRSFVAAILRSCQEQAGIENKLARARDEGWSKGHDAGLADGKRELEEVRKAVATFEEASGIKLTLDGHDRYHGYRTKQIGEAVRGVLERDLLGIETRVKAFEAASGVDVAATWNAGYVGEAFKTFLDSRDAGFQHRLEQLQKSARALIDDIDKFGASHRSPS